MSDSRIGSDRCQTTRDNIQMPYKWTAGLPHDLELAESFSSAVQAACRHVQSLFRKLSNVLRKAQTLRAASYHTHGYTGRSALYFENAESSSNAVEVASGLVAKSPQEALQSIQKGFRLLMSSCRPLMSMLRDFYSLLDNAEPSRVLCEHGIDVATFGRHALESTQVLRKASNFSSTQLGNS